MIQFPYRTKALRVRQELADCWVASLPAGLLLDVCFSDVLTAEHTGDPERPYSLGGNQREQREKRLQEIGRYIDRDDAAFPNSIILAANSRLEDGLIEDDPESISEDPDDGQGGSNTRAQGINGGTATDRRWQIIEGDDGCYELVIPTPDQLAAVVDGQHRLFGFTKAEVVERLDLEMICAIYLDLPKPYQAQIFATINSNQKRVDKSLTYELFGYNISDEEPRFWSPDKLAVFLTRRLGSDDQSPLRGKVTISPKKDAQLKEMTEGSEWRVSTAVIVEGIARLITSNPKADANHLQTPRQIPRAELEERRRDRSPLREAYINGQDKVIYTMVLNYLIAANQVFWADAEPQSFIRKTVGVQAVFDILRKIAGQAYEQKVISVDHFKTILDPAGSLDFTEDRFVNASGSGRSIIRRAIEAEIGLN